MGELAKQKHERRDEGEQKVQGQRPEDGSMVCVFEDQQMRPKINSGLSDPRVKPPNLCHIGL